MTKVDPASLYTGTTYRDVVYRYLLTNGQCGLNVETRQGIRRWLARMKGKEQVQADPWLPAGVESRLAASGSFPTTWYRDTELNRLIHTVMIADGTEVRQEVLEDSLTFRGVVKTPSVNSVQYSADCSAMAVAKASSDNIFPTASLKAMIENSASMNNNFLFVEGYFTSPLEFVFHFDKQQNLTQKQRISLLFDLAEALKDESDAASVVYRPNMHLLSLSYSSNSTLSGEGSLELSAGAGSSGAEGSSSYSASRSVSLNNYQSYIIDDTDTDGTTLTTVSTKPVQVSSSLVFSRLSDELKVTGRRATYSVINGDLLITLDLPDTACDQAWTMEVKASSKDSPNAATITTLPISIATDEALEKDGGPACVVTIPEARQPTAEDQVRLIFDVGQNTTNTVNNQHSPRKVEIPLYLPKL